MVKCFRRMSAPIVKYARRTQIKNFVSKPVGALRLITRTLQVLLSHLVSLPSPADGPDGPVELSILNQKFRIIIVY